MKPKTKEILKEVYGDLLGYMPFLQKSNDDDFAETWSTGGDVRTPYQIAELIKYILDTEESE